MFYKILVGSLERKYCILKCSKKGAKTAFLIEGLFLFIETNTNLFEKIHANSEVIFKIRS